MSKLTNEQKSIIDLLTNEFVKLNNPSVKSGGLIDVDAIISTAKAEENFIKEINLANQTFDKLKRNQMLKDIESLKVDLDALGLRVVVSELSCSFYIVSKVILEDDLSLILKNSYVYIYYKDTHYQTKTFNGITRTVDTKFGITFNRHSHFNTYYSDIKTATESEEFKDSLKNLYKNRFKIND